ncbi:MAG: hypothetical protein U0528_08520 [Anaerolineae bacterium]|nr:hypothetical protein [Anaerolineae bacterium]
MFDDTQKRVNFVQAYRESVESYEHLHEELVTLLQSKGGQTKNLSDDEYEQYRELAHRRDLAYNHMKTLERALLDDQ